MQALAAADHAEQEHQLLMDATGGDDSKGAPARAERKQVAAKRVATEMAREARLQAKAQRDANKAAEAKTATHSKHGPAAAKKQKADEFVSVRDNPHFRTLVAYGRSATLGPILTKAGYNLVPRALGSMKPDKLGSLLDEVEETLDGLHETDMMNGAIKRGMAEIEKLTVARTKHDISGWTASCWNNERWVVLLERAKIQSGLGVNRLSPMAQFAMMTASTAMLCKVKNSAMSGLGGGGPTVGTPAHDAMEAELSKPVDLDVSAALSGGGPLEPPPRKKRRTEEKSAVPDGVPEPPLPLTRQVQVQVPAPAEPTKKKRVYKKRAPKPKAVPVESKQSSQK